MKVNNKMYLLAVGAAAFVLSVTAGFGQVFNAADLSNRAVAASPRAKEEFPWLTRQSAKTGASIQTAETHTALSEVKKNRALAASPRMLEQFPELSRSARPQRTSTEDLVPPAVLKNSAFAASPRMIEQFPWLAIHPGQKAVEIAPVK